MIVYDFNVAGVAAPPLEADPPSVVDAYAVLAGPISLQFLKPIRGRDPQVGKRSGVVDHTQLSQRDLLN